MIYWRIKPPRIVWNTVNRFVMVSLKWKALQVWDLYSSLEWITSLRSFWDKCSTILFFNFPSCHGLELNEWNWLKKKNSNRLLGSLKEVHDAFVQDYHGLIHPLKLPSLNSLIHSSSLNNHQLQSLAFKVHRKRFTIETYHLPPEGEETSARTTGKHESNNSSSPSSVEDRIQKSNLHDWWYHVFILVFTYPDCIVPL